MINLIKKCNIMVKNDKVIAGVSGGADSMCMLNILCMLREELKLEIIVVHIDHTTRCGQSHKDAEFVEEECKKLNVKYLLYTYDLEKESKRLKMSCEEAGRFLRYEAFNEALAKEGADKIAIAHNADDNAETIIHNLCRGTGLLGLTGIKRVNGNIIRPILEFTKAEIYEFCKKNNIPYVEDYTNKEVDFTRNKIRNVIFPYITENINSKVVSNINIMARMISEEERYLDSVSSDAYMEAKTLIGDRLILDIEKLKKLDIVISRRVIRKAIKEISGNKLKDLSIFHVDSIIDVLDKGTGKTIEVPHNIICETVYGDLVFRKNQNANNNDSTHDNSNSSINIEVKINEVMNIGNMKLEALTCDTYNENDGYEYFDMNDIKGKIRIRNKADGDRLTISLDGKTKKVKDVLIDKKIPKEDRAKVLIIEDEEKILMVSNIKRAYAAFTNKNTELMLKIKLT